MSFAEYAQVVVSGLGDRIQTWATLNEPWCTAMLGYAAGVFAPGRREPVRAYDAVHHLLLGHALVAEALPDSDVGIVLNLTTVRTEPDGDPRAADVVDAWQNRVWLDALVDGRYPEVLGEPSALADGDLPRIQGSAAWLGINYYTPFRIGPPKDVRDAVGQDVDAFPGAPPFAFAPRPPLTTMGWEIDPQGLVDTLQATASRAPGVPLRVTENGGAFEDDQDRIAYFAGHLAALDASGVEVVDYFAWSLMDNFEWAQGYTQRFGLAAVEPGTLRRVPRGSFRWYQDYLAQRR